MFDVRRITLFCSEKRLSIHKMTIFSKNVGGAMAPLAPLGHVYGSDEFQVDILIKCMTEWEAAKDHRVTWAADLPRVKLLLV